MTENEKEEMITDNLSAKKDAEDGNTWRCSCCGSDNPDSERICAECGKYRF